jgi:hypothetical protein
MVIASMCVNDLDKRGIGETDSDSPWSASSL